MICLSFLQPLLMNNLIKKLVANEVPTYIDAQKQKMHQSYCYYYLPQPDPPRCFEAMIHEQMVNTMKGGKNHLPRFDYKHTLVFAN